MKCNVSCNASSTFLVSLERSRVREPIRCLPCNPGNDADEDALLRSILFRRLRRALYFRVLILDAFRVEVNVPLIDGFWDTLPQLLLI